jgi:anion-transporting  ArsA/GET3 family ATPase
VVVDAPATGHGVGILRTPRTFAEIARVGPIAHQGGQIARTIADREFTGVIAVSTPEEMAVNETINLDAALRAEGLTLEAAIVNARYPERFSDRDARTIRRALAGEPSADRNVRVALRAALSERERSRGQALQQERLEASLACPVITLPFVFAPVLGPAELATLSAALEDVLP